MTKQRGVSKHQAAFLAAFQILASITKAAAAARIDRDLHYQWLDKDPSYPARFAAAQDQAAQTLEDEAVERATTGVFEPTVYQGEFTYPFIEKIDPETGTIFRERSETPYGLYKKSDALLMFLLKKMRPAYRETWKGEISGPGGGPIPLEEQRLKTLTDEELSALLAVARKLAATGGDGSGTEAPAAE